MTTAIAVVKTGHAVALSDETLELASWTWGIGAELSKSVREDAKYVDAPDRHHERVTMRQLPIVVGSELLVREVAQTHAIDSRPGRHDLLDNPKPLERRESICLEQDCRPAAWN